MSFFNIFRKLTLARIYPGNFQLLSKNEFKAVLATFVVMTMVPRLLRKFKRLL